MAHVGTRQIPTYQLRAQGAAQKLLLIAGGKSYAPCAPYVAHVDARQIPPDQLLAQEAAQKLLLIAGENI